MLAILMGVSFATNSLAADLESSGIWVEPSSFDVNIIEGCTKTETLTIGNDGIEDLNFTLRSREISREILGGLSGGGTAAPAVKLAKNNIVLEYQFSEPYSKAGGLLYRILR